LTLNVAVNTVQRDCAACDDVNMPCLVFILTYIIISHPSDSAYLYKQKEYSLCPCHVLILVVFKNTVYCMHL